MMRQPTPAHTSPKPGRSRPPGATSLSAAQLDSARLAIAGLEPGADQRDLLPSRLSPSRAQDFIQCPRKFHFKTILKLSEPPTIHTARGTIAHTALERLFDLPRGQRSVEAAVAMVAPAWDELLAPDVSGLDEFSAGRALGDAAAYAAQVEAGSIDPVELVTSAEQMVRNYFSMEDPSAFDPEGRELRLAADAAGVPLHGIIDRLDKVPDGNGGFRWYISDYKTAGKVPADRWIDDKFFAMRVYAVLAKEQLGIDVSGLRLIFLVGAHPSAIKYQPVTQATIVSTTNKLKALWKTINDAARRDVWPTRTGPLCNWCPFMDICPAWASELDGVPVSVE
jgi:putative RecB family exonuclease